MLSACQIRVYNAPGRTRTCDIRIRNPLIGHFDPKNAAQTPKNAPVFARSARIAHARYRRNPAGIVFRCQTWTQRPGATDCTPERQNRLREELPLKVLGTLNIDDTKSEIRLDAPGMTSSRLSSLLGSHDLRVTFDYAVIRYTVGPTGNGAQATCVLQAIQSTASFKAS